jgi:hypothetical protein
MEILFDLTRRQTYPFRIISMMNQRSIVLYLYLKGLSAHMIHVDLAVTLDPKAVAHSTMTRYLREAKPGTVEVTLDPEQSHLTSMIPIELSWQPRKRRKAVFVHAKTCPSHLDLTRMRYRL